jgi:hypothetical protein
LLGLFIKVLGSIARLSLTRTVEVIKHQVHVFLLLDLQVVADLYVAVHLYFYVSVSLSTQRSRFVKLTLPILLLQLHATPLGLARDRVAVGLLMFLSHIKLLTVLEQRLLLPIRNVKCVATSVLGVLISVYIVFSLKVFIGIYLLTVVDALR